MNNLIKVALVDDHTLLRKGLAGLISSLGFAVHLECENGRDLINKLNSSEIPDIILMDINMPEMDGFETALWLKKNFPLVNVLALSMYDDEIAIIRMLKCGAKGYILKDANPLELKKAIDAVMTKGFYYSEAVTGRLVHSIRDNDNEDNGAFATGPKLNEREIKFLKLCCSELTYKEVANEMNLSPRTIDGYREALFEKLNIKSRVGLVLYSIKYKFFQVSEI